MKRLCIFLACLLLLCCAGCATSATAVSPAPSATAPKEAVTANLANVDRSVVLSEYPIEKLPPYLCEKVTLCSFDTNDQAGYAIGRDTYTLRYETAAGKEDIFSFYEGLLTTKDTPYNEKWLNGKIGANLVSIGFVAKEGKANEVTLVYSIEDEGEPDANPYFKQYPRTVKVLGGNKNKLYGTAYERYNGGDMKERYVLTYESTLTPNEFSTLYEKAYHKSKSFSKSEDDKIISYAFDTGVYDYEVILTKSNGTAAFLTILCTQKANNISR